MKHMTSITIKLAATLALLALASCAHVSKTVTGPGGYSYRESISASGRSNIEAAAQQFGGSLIVETPESHIEAKLNSTADATGVSSDNAMELLAAFVQTLQAILALASKQPVPIP